jgi:hypothetical protein
MRIGLLHLQPIVPRSIKVVFVQPQYLQKLGFDILHRCGCDANFEPHIQNTVISLISEFGVTCVCWW